MGSLGLRGDLHSQYPDNKIPYGNRTVKYRYCKGRAFCHRSTEMKGKRAAWTEQLSSIPVGARNGLVCIAPTLPSSGPAAGLGLFSLHPALTRRARVMPRLWG